ncbi:MAG: DUF4062 domain-containing protein [Nitrospirae bacterium]|nr:DUF4062 domain-containing protein [Nitrospirota bacterium]
MISSTIGDLEKDREIAEQVVKQLGHKVFRSDREHARPQSSVQVCIEKSQGCDIYVGILGAQYGSFVPDRQVSFVEMEFDEAQGSDPTKVLIFARNMPAADDRQKAFRDRVLQGPKGYFATMYQAPEQLERSIRGALVDWIAKRVRATAQKGRLGGGDAVQGVPLPVVASAGSLPALEVKHELEGHGVSRGPEGTAYNLYVKLGVHNPHLGVTARSALVRYGCKSHHRLDMDGGVDGNGQFPFPRVPGTSDQFEDDGRHPIRGGQTRWVIRIPVEVREPAMAVEDFEVEFDVTAEGFGRAEGRLTVPRGEILKLIEENYGGPKKESLSEERPFVWYSFLVCPAGEFSFATLARLHDAIKVAKFAFRGGDSSSRRITFPPGRITAIGGGKSISWSHSVTDTDVQSRMTFECEATLDGSFRFVVQEEPIDQSHGRKDVIPVRVATILSYSLLVLVLADRLFPRLRTEKLELDLTVETAGPCPLDTLPFEAMATSAMLHVADRRDLRSRVRIPRKMIRSRDALENGEGVESLKDLLDGITNAFQSSTGLASVSSEDLHQEVKRFLDGVVRGDGSRGA